jgi:hypothetical protein
MSAAKQQRAPDEPATDDPILTTRVGLQFPSGLSFEGWERAGRHMPG